MSTLEPATIFQAIENARTRWPDQVAVADGDLRVSFAALAAEVENASAALMANGVRRGERVAIWAPNELAWIVAALATTSIGAVLVPMNTRFKGYEAADIIARTSARILFVHQGFLENDYVGFLAEACSVAPDATAVVAAFPDLSAIVDFASTGSPGTIPWSEFAAGSRVPIADVRAQAALVATDDLCDIIFTSGTTGRPKGAMSAHRQTLGVASAWARAARMVPDDNYLIVNPFFHTFGYKAGFLVCLLSGATVVPQIVFNPAEMLRLIEAHRITILPGPPTVFHAMLEHPDRRNYDLSSLRLASTGASIVPVALVERMQQELSFDTVLTAYGLSEAVVVTMSDPDDDPAVIARTVGTATSGFEIKVVDSAGASLPAGETGEICVRGPNLMTGYFEDAAATAAVIDAEGWFRTGDVGHLHVDGHLTITDRLGDMFTVGGFNVYPAEIEQVITHHPSVLECAVVPAPDVRLGSVGRAFVVPRAEVHADPAEIVAFARERLANYKVPASVEIVAELPRNAAGKVLRRVLRDQAAAETAASTTPTN
jgi:acyl-CoA synthetase (AMP-forming)/AMP-acid ligase II